MIFNQKQKGLSVIEIMVVVFILTIAIIAFYQAAVFSFQVLKESKNEMKAGYLAEEGVEAVRNIRDRVAWDDPADGKTGIGELDLDLFDTYYLIPVAPVSGDNWGLVVNDPGLIDNLFTRKIVFEEVSRDPGSGDIQPVYIAVDDDPNSRKFSVIVNWQERGEIKDVTLVTYITNFNN